jgi:hypothetical protein
MYTILVILPRLNCSTLGYVRQLLPPYIGCPLAIINPWTQPTCVSGLSELYYEGCCAVFGSGELFGDDKDASIEDGREAMLIVYHG